VITRERSPTRATRASKGKARRSRASTEDKSLDKLGVLKSTSRAWATSRSSMRRGWTDRGKARLKIRREEISLERQEYRICSARARDGHVPARVRRDAAGTRDIKPDRVEDVMAMVALFVPAMDYIPSTPPQARQEPH